MNNLYHIKWQNHFFNCHRRRYGGKWTTNIAFKNLKYQKFKKKTWEIMTLILNFLCMTSCEYEIQEKSAIMLNMSGRFRQASYNMLTYWSNKTGRSDALVDNKAVTNMTMISKQDFVKATLDKIWKLITLSNDLLIYHYGKVFLLTTRPHISYIIEQFVFWRLQIFQIPVIRDCQTAGS